MTTAQIVVTVLGLVAILWVNYWFFWGDSARLSPRVERGDHSSAPSLRSG